MALALAGCDSGDRGGDEGPVIAGYPLTVQTSQGEVTIDAPPQRVVALSVTTADELLSLGVEPISVAVNPDELQTGYPWLTDGFADLADAGLIDGNFELDVEAIAALEPDLIMAHTYQVSDRTVFERLNAIAPTITPASDAVNVDWDERLLKTAEAMGKLEEAQALIAELEAEFRAVGESVPDISTRTYQWVRADPEGYVFGNGSVLELFGMAPAANQDNTQNQNASVSKENTDELDADLLAVWAPTDDLRGELDADPLFQRLPSVRAGTVIYADLDFANALNSPSPTSLRWTIAEVSPYIESLGE